ncbi:MAG: 16S rRNA (adenine(1518)-N(6)/adenine(1519)-N(6))-dimethyltransferase RsmA [Acidimicrobiales bacterium]|jgi:16S rRNA (adenine1518-N6/adenine1519-N6)-dimethyltransferase|nr:16S rRNA (adenine(1518)-N(6)/adenine(1519)-N(6))-dimethyltransferase RsmA [Acidimicrobiales bacterium]|tara:strand:+ start:42 stop:872 length:831 start_codon:yes stop_codon:yes gene_type:complete
MVVGKSDLKDMMEKHDLRPSKSLGQNFVVDPNTILKIIRAANIEKGEQILEIGPGLGSLTSQLSVTSKVVAIELDRYLIPALEEVLNHFGKRENVEIVQEDAMKIDWQEFFTQRQGVWKMVANLPYNIATPLLVTLLENAPEIQAIYVMVQLEVGERFAASPRSKAYGIPSVKAQYWAETKVLGKVSPNVFLPVPKVDSAILQIIRKSSPPEVNYANFSRLIQTAFQHRRKMIRKSLNTLVPLANFSIAELSPQARPEELSVTDWVKLAKTLDTAK